MGPKKNQLPHFWNKKNFPRKMDSSELIVGPYLHVKNQKKMSQFQKKKCYIRKDRHTEKLKHEKIELNTEDLPAETVVQYMRASSLKNLSIFYTKKRELLWWSYSVSSSSMPRRGTALLNHVVPYPAIFSGYRFFDKRNKEKNRSAAGESRRALQALPSGIHRQIFGKSWLFYIQIAQNIAFVAQHIVGLVHERSFVYF